MASGLSSAVAFLAALVLAAPANATSINYQVTVDTSSLFPISSGTYSGYLDLQFNPGALPGTQSAGAVVSFAPQSCNCVFGNGISTGNVNVAPGRRFVVLENLAPLNDYFFPVTFSGNIGFTLLINGDATFKPDPNAISGTAFGVSLYDGTGLTPLLTSDPDGFLAVLNLNVGGSLTTETFPNAEGGTSTVTLTDLNAPPPSPVPEPGTLLYLGTGLVAGLVWVRR